MKHQHQRRSGPQRYHKISLPPRPLPRTLSHILVGSPSTLSLRPLLLSIQHKAQDIKGELREIHAHLAESAFGLMAQNMGALAPEAGDGFADGVVVAGGVRVDVAGVVEFGGGGRVDEVNFRVGEGFECLLYNSYIRTALSLSHFQRKKGGKTYRHLQFLR